MNIMMSKKQTNKQTKLQTRLSGIQKFHSTLSRHILQQSDIILCYYE